MNLPEPIPALAARLGGPLSVAALHLGTGESLDYDLDRRFPAASLIKVPMMGTVLAEAAAGRLDLAEIYHLRAEDQVGDEGVLQLQPPGTPYSLATLVELMIQVSDNTATNVLIDRLGGYAPYNAFFAAAGLSATVLQRHMIDYAAREAGRENWTTARDMLTLLQALALKQLVDPGLSRQMVTIMLEQQDREKLPAGMPPEFPIASKPGELPGGVRHDMGIVYTHTGPVIIVLLSDGVDTAQADATLAEIGRCLFDAVGGEAYQG